MSPSVAIIAHGGAQETFDRHLKFWEAINPNPTVYCPYDAPIKTKNSTVEFGSKGRAISDSIIRLKLILEQFIQKPADYLLLFEYDSICFDHSPLPPDPGAICGNPMPSLDARFLAPRYLNPPWRISVQAALAILQKAKEYPFLTEHGEADRWLSAMAHLAGVPMLPYEPRGYSRQTIGHEHLSELRTAIYEGATMIHGIKYEVILNEAVKYHAEREKFR